MFKYATFLEACTVSMQQMLILFNHPDVSQVFDSKSPNGYEAVLEVIEEQIEDSSQKEIARQRFEKGFLHAMWLRYECEPWSFSLLPDIETSPPPREATSILWNASLDLMFQRVNAIHDTLLKIAAKCGDSWAIQSFPLGIFSSHEFNDDVKEQHPLLMHRHLGTHRVVSKRSNVRGAFTAPGESFSLVGGVYW